MAYVPVPKDLTRVKSKFLFNLTKRQVICFGLGALVGVPLFFLTKDSIGPSLATFIMIAVMLPFFMFAMFERHGQPLEVMLGHFIQARFVRPRKRIFQTSNFYETIQQNIRNRREVNQILHGKNQGKTQTDASRKEAAAGADAAKSAKRQEEGPPHSPGYDPVSADVAGRDLPRHG